MLDKIQQLDSFQLIKTLDVTTQDYDKGYKNDKENKKTRGEQMTLEHGLLMGL